VCVHVSAYLRLYTYDDLCIFISFFRSVTIASGGVLPNIHSVLLPKEILAGGKGAKKDSKEVKAEEQPATA
jgi:hypothetical protein